MTFLGLKNGGPLSRCHFSVTVGLFFTLCLNVSFSLKTPAELITAPSSLSLDSGLGQGQGQSPGQGQMSRGQGPSGHRRTRTTSPVAMMRTTGTNFMEGTPPRLPPRKSSSPGQQRTIHQYIYSLTLSAVQMPLCKANVTCLDFSPSPPPQQNYIWDQIWQQRQIISFGKTIQASVWAALKAGNVLRVSGGPLMILWWGVVTSLKDNTANYW